MVDALLTVGLAHAGKRVRRDKGHGDQRACQTSHKCLIDLQLDDGVVTLAQDLGDGVGNAVGLACDLVA